MKNEFDKIAGKYIAPVLVKYTGWVLSESERLGIKHLYFLARDGYQMFHIAGRNCNNNNIESSYFYCSRYSLRMAAYRFFDDSAYDRLFIPAFSLSAENMLKRADFSEDERSSVYDDIGFVGKENTVMGREEFSLFCDRIKNSVAFNDILKKKSDRAYADTIAYINQEGMQDCDKIGIVDLGWTGSLQYTLRRLLDSIDVKATIHGFYMGMLDKPPRSDNNEYHTWLFDENDIGTKAWFSHNLMECICSAPHGTTTGYFEKAGRIHPVLVQNENVSSLSERIRYISLRYAEKHGIRYSTEDKSDTLKRLHGLMFSPTAAETKALGVYDFCDDVGEQYHRSIVQRVSPADFFKEILPMKVFFRDSADGLYWYYGTLAASDAPFKFVIKYGYYCTKCILSLIRRR